MQIIDFFLNYKVSADLCALLRFLTYSYFVFCLIWIRKDAHIFSEPNGPFSTKHFIDHSTTQIKQITLFSFFNSSLARDIIFCLFYISGIFSAIGFLTTVSMIVFYITFVSIQSRISVIIYGASDNVARIVLFCLLLTNCSSTYSVDHLIGLSSGAPIVDGWAIRLLQIHLVFIYLWCATHKLDDGWWRRGAIVRNVLYSPTWSRRVFLDVFKLPFIYKPLCYGTVMLEYMGPLFLLVSETRIIAMLVFISFHAGITIFTRVGFFGPIMIIADLSFANQLFIK
jgi:hypothetical protein